MYAEVLVWPVLFAGSFICWWVSATYSDWRATSKYMRARSNKRHLKFVAAREKAEADRIDAFFNPHRIARR